MLADLREYKEPTSHNIIKSDLMSKRRNKITQVEREREKKKNLSHFQVRVEIVCLTTSNFSCQELNEMSLCTFSPEF